MSKTKIEKLILQIQKIRNVSAPKSNEDSQAAPRMLKLILTDGHAHCQAIEITSIPALNSNKTPPGTKILLENVEIHGGFLLLQQTNCKVLGGKVPVLFEKWDVARSLSVHTRNSGSIDGPPPWVNFGQKVTTNLEMQNFKSLENKGKEDKQNSEFEDSRKNAIAEVASSAVKKVFGGGTKQALLVESEKKFENKVEVRRDKGGRKGKKEVKEKEEKLQRPTEKISLFDFLEDKLPVNENQGNEGEEIKDISKTESEKNDRGNRFNYNNKGYQSNNSKGYQNNSNKNYQSNSGRGYYSGNSKNYQCGNSNYQAGNSNHQSGNSNYQSSNSKCYQNSNSKDYQNSNSNQFTKNAQGYNPTFKKNHTIGEKNQSTPNYQKGAQNNTRNQQSSASNSQNNFNRNKTTNNSFDLLPNQMDKLSLNSQFASRSFKQHLNFLSGSKPTDSSKLGNFDFQWKIGDHCMAKYWEDGRFYNASILDLTPKTLVVQFMDYGNIEEVLRHDCKPINQDVGDCSKNPFDFQKNKNKTYFSKGYRERQERN